MVNHSHLLFAVCDSKSKKRSGTIMTVNYARNTGLPILFIHPKTMEITFKSKSIAPSYHF